MIDFPIQTFHQWNSDIKKLLYYNRMVWNVCIGSGRVKVKLIFNNYLYKIDMFSVIAKFAEYF